MGTPHNVPIASWAILFGHCPNWNTQDGLLAKVVSQRPVCT